MCEIENETPELREDLDTYAGQLWRVSASYEASEDEDGYQHRDATPYEEDEQDFLSRC